MLCEGWSRASLSDDTLSEESLYFLHVYFSFLDPVKDKVHVLNWDMSYLQVKCALPQCLEPELWSDSGVWGTFA